MIEDRGSVPIWFLGLAFCLLMLGAMSAELWRILGERSELVAMADGAAIAAASAIDLEEYRRSGTATIDPVQAEMLALSVLARASGAADLSETPMVVVAEDRTSVRVELRRAVELGLIRFLGGESEGFVVTGVAVAYPYSPGL